MSRFVEGVDRSQAVLFPERLDDYIGADNPVRVVDVFVGNLDLRALGFNGVVSEVTGRPAYHPTTSATYPNAMCIAVRPGSP